MRRRFALATFASLAALLGVPALVARAGDAPPAELPKPPTTPLPKFENPLHDCEVGETMSYRVKQLDKEDGWVRYFEERVLARTKDEALIETIETNAAGTSVFAVDTDARNTGWRPADESLAIKADSPQKWLTDKQKDEVLYLGTPPTRAIRAVHRFLQEPESFSRPDGPKQVRQVWFSHDIPCTGKAKMFPAQGGGERQVISWTKRLTPEECAKLAAKYPHPEPEAKKDAPTGGMDEPGMTEPAMNG